MSSAVPHPLVTLNEVSQALTIGIGAATASVRTLTAVSLAVHPRELVVLAGSRGAGERALIAVIAGDRRGVTGVCELRQGVRVRLLRICTQAALALAQSWYRTDAAYGSGEPNDSTGADTEPGETNPPHPTPSAELFLLDVVHDASSRASGVQPLTRSHAAASPRPWDDRNRSALLAWAAVCRQRGGAVVMAAGERVCHGLFDAALPHAGGAAGSTSVVREAAPSPSCIRVVPMHCGRLAPAVRLRGNERSS